jgi:hypothetical protein
MNAFHALFVLKIAAFFSIFLALTILWCFKNHPAKARAAVETAVLLLLKLPFKFLHALLWVTGKFFDWAADVISFGANMILFFTRAIYRTAAASIRNAKRDFFPVLFVGLAFFSSAAVVAFFIERPEPRVHDEFSYLLQADTFAHGRLTNPTHPLWRHFQSFHIIQQPSYASKYPPAQGFFLAVGQILTDRPIVGVWLSFGLMGAALYWALKAFFPSGWALLGTALMGIRIGFIGQPILVTGVCYWSQSYWGGAPAAFGGALLFGAFRRLWDKPSIPRSLMMGIGLAVLANSRPYEGFLASLPVDAALLYWLFRDPRFPWKVKCGQVLMPLFLTVALTGSWMAYYQWRVTGDPFKVPYQVHEETYGMPPLFIGQKTHPRKDFRDPVLKSYYVDYVHRLYAFHSTPKGYANLTIHHVKQNFMFFLGIFLFIPLLFLRKEDVVRDPWAKLLVLTCLATTLGGLPMERLPLPHYTAPVTFSISYFVTRGLIRLRDWHWKTVRVGKSAICFILLFTAAEIMIPIGNGNDIPGSVWYRDRAKIVDRLKSLEGRHLVIVRYAPGHSFHNEWVYNGADIDHSKIVWAREISPEEDLPLLRYFSGRKVWLLEPDETPVALTPYTAQVSRR